MKFFLVLMGVALPVLTWQTFELGSWGGLTGAMLVTFILSSLIILFQALRYSMFNLLVRVKPGQLAVGTGALLGAPLCVLYTAGSVNSMIAFIVGFFLAIRWGGGFAATPRIAVVLVSAAFVLGVEANAVLGVFLLPSAIVGGLAAGVLYREFFSRCVALGALVSAPILCLSSGSSVLLLMPSVLMGSTPLPGEPLALGFFTLMGLFGCLPLVAAARLAGELREGECFRHLNQEKIRTEYLRRVA